MVQVILFTLALSSPAYADCPATPIGNANDMVVSFMAIHGTQNAPASLMPSTVKEGMLVYDSTADTLKLCDGTTWQSISMGTASDPRIGTLDAGKWCSTDGTIINCTTDAPATVVGLDKQVIFNDGGTTLAGAAQLFWDKGTNRLGLGTSTPPIALVVNPTNAPMPGYSAGTDRIAAVSAGNSVIQVTAGAAAQSAVFFSDVDSRSAGGLVYSHATDTMQVRVADSIKMTVLPSGNVGIGTSSPQALLHVTGDIGIPYQFALKTIGSTANNNLLYNYYDGAFDKLEIAPTGNSRSRIGFLTAATNATAPAERMTITHGGFVGIGTTSPLRALHVETANGRAGIFKDDSVNLQHVAGDILGRLDLGFEAGSNRQAVAGIAAITETNVTTGIGVNHAVSGALGFYTLPNTGTLANDAAAPVERMRISHNGRVGIGTSNPTSTLEIVGNPLLASGNVTTDNIARQALFGTRHYSLAEKPFIGFQAYVDAVSNQSIIGGGTATGYAATVVRFYTAEDTTTLMGTERMRIHHDGNVGIGTANPLRRLHVASAANDNADTVLLGSFAIGTAGASVVPADKAQLALSGVYNAAYNGHAEPLAVKLWIGSYDNDGSVVYPIYVEDENNLPDFWIRNKPSEGGLSVAYFQGRVGIGNTAPSSALHVTGNIGATGWVGAGCETACSSDGSHAIMYADGRIVITSDAYKPGGGTWTASSDARLKDVDGAYAKGLDAVAALRPVTFHYKKGNARNEPADRAFVGLIAQEVQSHFPEAVTPRGDGYLDLDATPISFAVINAIRELKAANERLAGEVAALRSRLDGARP